MTARRRIPTALALALLLGPRISMAIGPASGLSATGLSASSIALAWKDPNAGEVGFHVQRSIDGSAFTTIDNVASDVTAYVDAGRPAATLHYYRVVAFDFAGDGPPSNVAAASTHPASAVSVPPTRLSTYHPLARMASAAHDGVQWAVAWQERRDGKEEDIYFQLLDQATGAPLGAPLAVSDTDSPSVGPTLKWSGSRFGLLWQEVVRGPGTQAGSSYRFAVLRADGSKLRGDVSIGDGTLLAPTNGNQEAALVANGAGWGLFASARVSDPSDLVYYRISSSGDVLVDRRVVAASPDWDHEVSAAWNGSEYGVAWVQHRDTVWKVLFQRVALDGTPIGSPALLATSAAERAAGETAVVPDGTGWAVVWVDRRASYSLGGEQREWVHLRRLDAAGTPIGAAAQLSDEWDTRFPPGQYACVDQHPQLVRKPGGGFLVFTSSVLKDTNVAEICRLEADASGQKAGTRAILTPLDGRHSAFGRIASDGSGFLAVFNDAAASTQEVAAIRLDASGAPAAGPSALTAGHAAGSATSISTVTGQKVQPLGSGFVVLWTDREPPPQMRLQAAILDGAGGIVTRSPLSARTVPATGYALVSVGSTFAVAFYSGSTLYFCRYDATGAPLMPEVVLSPSASGGVVAMDFSGEDYGVAWPEPVGELGLGRIFFQRFRPDGTPLGTKVMLGLDMPLWSQDLPALRWTGNGWAVLWDAYGGDPPDDDFFYGFVDPSGNVTIPGIQVTFSDWVPGFRAEAGFAWNGGQLGVVRGETRGIDPPGQPIFYLGLGLDGFKTAAERIVATGELFSVSSPVLYWKGDRYGLVHVQDIPDTLREIELLPSGDVLPGFRTLASRGGATSVAWNGVTLGVAWIQRREVYFQTDACLSDSTPPSCPTVQGAFDGASVSLSYTAASDPESPVTRYLVYRDGILVAENDPARLSYVDGGAPAGRHVYEVRALNAALRESAACASLVVTTVRGDADGDGLLTVADLFRLVDALSGGPAPLGYMDVNGDGSVTAADASFLFDHLFVAGPPPG